jgi:sRNA-binding protein
MDRRKDGNARLTQPPHLGLTRGGLDHRHQQVHELQRISRALSDDEAPAVTATPTATPSATGQRQRIELSRAKRRESNRQVAEASVGPEGGKWVQVRRGDSPYG